LYLDYSKYPAIYRELRTSINTKEVITINGEDIEILTPDTIKQKHYITIPNKGLLFNDDTRASLIIKLKI